MYRTWILALVVLAGAEACAEAQRSYRLPAPAAFPSLEGQWFYAGDPRQPCYIDMETGGFRGPRLIFTNERGEQTEGRLLEDGRRVLAYNWGGGNLVGDVRRTTIEWRNGTTWTRGERR